MHITEDRKHEVERPLVTMPMIEAGTERLRDFSFGEPWERIVEAIYIAMHLTAQTSDAASSINSAR